MDHMSIPVSFAPMEGITTYLFRRVFDRHFPGTDRFYTPFLSANQTLHFKNKEIQDVLPQNNEGLHVIPQILGNKADEVAWAMSCMQEYGYEEVNFNLGCPMATVAKRGKGAGFLFPPETLDRFFNELFDRLSENRASGLKISVKTRIGVKDPEEARDLIEIYNRYPVCSLIIHPRLQTDLYRGHPDLETFLLMYEESRHPVVYNGDITRPSEVDTLLKRFPGLQGVMIGRGFLRDPALLRRIRGGKALSAEELVRYEQGLYEALYSRYNNDSQTVARMKEIWTYMKSVFLPGGAFGMEGEGSAIRRKEEKQLFAYATDIREETDSFLPGEETERAKKKAIKKLFKAKRKDQYREAVDALFAAARSAEQV